METQIEPPETVIKLYDQNVNAWKIVKKDKEPQKSLEIIGNALKKLGLSEQVKRKQAKFLKLFLFIEPKRIAYSVTWRSVEWFHRFSKSRSSS